MEPTGRDAAPRPPSSEPATAWRAGDEETPARRPDDPEERGLRRFFRKLAVLFSLDPRSGGR